MQLSWAAAPGRVQQYRVAYQPTAGGEMKEVTVRGDNTATVLKGLQPGTEYQLAVRARYSSGSGQPLQGTGTTLEGMIAHNCPITNMDESHQDMSRLHLNGIKH